jgi:hypothetical protein
MRIVSSVINNGLSRRWKQLNLGKAIIFSILLTVLSPVFGASPDTFTCGGSLENKVWTLWDNNTRAFVEKSLLHDRLKEKGDTYALYDFQGNLHNLASMARRCNRSERLLEITNLIQFTYKQLEDSPANMGGRAWICRGGKQCTEKNRRVNKEVMLYSVQFLGMASSVANAIASSKNKLSPNERVYVRDTVQITIEHLLRWGKKSELEKIHKAIYTGTQEVMEDHAELRFTDKSLWLITIYAELAGIFEKYSLHDLGLPELDSANASRLQKHSSLLLQLFSSRTTLHHQSKKGVLGKNLADIDRGYWRNHKDNLYAGFDENKKPVSCVYQKGNKSKFRMDIHIQPNSVPKLPDTGWDISHARRLVHAFDAIERNRKPLEKFSGLNQAQVPSSQLFSAFANTLIEDVWNGDAAYPLFSNFLSGANGWYRVAYDNGTGECREGTPPYGLTTSFASGGYITWGQYHPQIGKLGTRLYELTQSSDPAATSFIKRYYHKLNEADNKQNLYMQQMMFWPSLISPK